MTGFTQELINKDLDLKGFALVCARAFGVCAMMRDDSLDTPIPEEFKPSVWHRDAGSKAKIKLAKFMKMKSKTDREAWATRELKKQISVLKKHAKMNNSETQIKKMQAMLVEVNAWVPPSEEHAPLKKYMQDQLMSSIESDGNNSGYYDREAQVLRDTKPLDYYLAEVKRTKENIAYHKKEWLAEVARTNQRNTWIKKLRDSLSDEALGSQSTL